MLLIFSILSLLALGKPGSAILSDKATVADFLFDSATLSHDQAWDIQTISTNRAGHQHSNVLQERAPSFETTSYTLVNDHLFQWIFGNTTSSVNISVSTCVNLTDTAGPYQFDDGSFREDATMMDIMSDLGFGTSSEAQGRYANRTLSNAQSAYDEMQAFLTDDILVRENSLNHAKPLIRREFQSNGRVMALVIRTVAGAALGLAGARIAGGPEVTHGQLAAGALTTGGLLVLVGIIDIIREEGGMAIIEPVWMRRVAAWVANAFIAVMRKMVRSARENPAYDARRYTQEELDEYLENLGRRDVFEVWDASAEDTPGTSSSIEGFCDEV